jgi:hypothetical protein
MNTVAGYGTQGINVQLETYTIELDHVLLVEPVHDVLQLFQLSQPIFQLVSEGLQL